MIFLTTGTQLPFDRLVKAVDLWAAEHGDISIFGQIGKGSYQPKHYEFVESLSPVDYDTRFNQAKLIVSHVGMGTIISGLERAKPLLLMPRLADLGEHRNDHQLSTAEKFGHHLLIDIASDERAFPQSLNNKLKQLEAINCEGMDLQPSATLIERIRGFVEGDF